MRFVGYPGDAEEPLPGTNIASLFADRDGALWIGFRPGGAALLAGGHVTRFGESEGLPDGTVEQFARDRDGTLWAATRRGLAKFNGSRWEKFADPRIETPYALLVDRDGTLWVGANNGLFAWVAGERLFREIDRSLSFGAGGTALAQAPDGSIWAAPHHKLVRVERPAEARLQGAAKVAGISSGPLLFDAPGNLWASESAAKSLLRVQSGDLADEKLPRAVSAARAAFELRAVELWPCVRHLAGSRTQCLGGHRQRPASLQPQQCGARCGAPLFSVWIHRRGIRAGSRRCAVAGLRRSFRRSCR